MTGEWQPIPGETPIDPSLLKDKSIRTRGELAKAEAENIRKAYVKYLAAKPSKRLAPFDFSWLCRLHREMFCDVLLVAGQLRDRDLNIGVPWTQVSEQLAALAKDLDHWATATDMAVVEQATRLHHRSVEIHPFYNGNGRWARALANIWLYRNDQPLVRWPENAIGNVSPVRDKYLAALRAADQGEYELLISLHRRFMGE